jgi:iron(III) transport system substrate-binding protein
LKWSISLVTNQHPLNDRMNRRRLAKLAAGSLVIAGAATRPGRALATIENESTPNATPVEGASLTIYSGRSESLVGALIPKIEAATGLKLDVRYGNTAELAAQILEEGKNTPAGLFFAQDAGALGALAKAELFTTLPAETLEKVDPRFHADNGTWIGLSGRERVLVYNPEVTDPATLPTSILDLPTAELGGPIGWAPSNASFQSFVTALRLTEGEDAARAWLEGIIATEPVSFEGNAPQIDAVANQEIAVGLVNHYYLYQARKETPDINAENYIFPNGDLGALINIAGAGIIASGDQQAAAAAALDYLLGVEAQTFFATETSEYPLADNVPAIADLTPLAELQTPDIDLSNLDDLEGTLALLTDLSLI